MKNPETERLKYPIGVFTPPVEITPDDIKSYIEVISGFPEKLEALVSGLSEEQLNTRYRKGGWTVKQVIHHLADSHMNAFIRFKLALTEDIPTVKPYYEDKWAELGDVKTTDIKVSMDLIKALHKRWNNLLRSMDEKDFEKSFFHPEQGKEFTLKEIAALYSWHCSHHFEHINHLKIG